jgi:hypothetical protein
MRDLKTHWIDGVCNFVIIVWCWGYYSLYIKDDYLYSCSRIAFIGVAV